MAEVILYTKPGCCLCHTVKAQLNKIRRRHPFELREVNILEDLNAFARFQEEIPVVFVHGQKAFQYHMDEREFLRLLESAPQTRERQKNGS